MAASFVAFPSLSMVRKEDFSDTSLIPEAYGRHIVSRCLPPERSPVHCSFSAEPVGSGIRLRFSSRVGGLGGPAMLTHKFFFVDRDETRERFHLVTPDEPEATTDLLILLADSDRDYCHASVYDAENRLLAVHAVVFDRAGRTVPYPFTQRYVSPLGLGRADLEETVDDAGDRVLRFSVGLTGLTGPTPVVLAWQGIGRIVRQELTCTPDRPEAHYDVALDGNPLLACGDWVVIAVDERDRFLAQTLVTLQTAAG
ncbi:DUF5944 family protein [Streptomyces sp. UNOC14_S4]|uniref:DUF5944 family protein n=1 Tax=Streptomyces sp. UNOC14_S4 TaxID=2872340 RepID=UPI001E5174CD|nr:DUF5944 family protein [Streptomyces sp. UNOC14_S4]MCC3770093.1 hypothetical protein [Streptomyces sp. UNOC14_S4]